MKIAMLNGGVRGPATYCLNLYKYLEKQGHEVLLISEAKWHKEQIPIFQAKSRLFLGLAPVVYKPWEVIQQLKDFQPDIIHHHWPCGTMDLLFSRILKLQIPTVVTIHVSVNSREFLWDKAFYLHFGVFKRYLKKTQSVINISKFIEGQVKKRTRLPPSMHHLIYAGVDDKVFKPQKRKKDDTLKLLFVGQIMPEKGVDTLINAVKIANKKRKIKLTIIGQGHLRSTLVKRTKNDKYLNWVGFIKSQKTIAKYYSDADLTVLPTRWDEAFSLVPVESLSCGTPVMATKRGGTPEVIIPKKTGYFLKSHKPEDIANALLNLDTDDLEKMRKSAYAHAQKNYTLNLWGKHHEELYKEILIESK